MPEYMSPGVYMEEFDSGARAIEGVSTSTAAFLGKTERGSLNPRLVTSFAEFTRVFGDWIQDSYLAYSVDGFFKNGGKRCYVARITTDYDRRKRNFKAIIRTLDKKYIQIRPIGPGEWITRLRIIVKKGSNYTKENNFIKITVEYWDTETSLKKNPDEPDWVEVFDDLSTIPESDYYYENIVNGRSNFITLLPIDFTSEETEEEKITEDIINQIIRDYPGSTPPEHLVKESITTIFVKLDGDAGQKHHKVLPDQNGNNCIRIETKEEVASGSVWVAIKKATDHTAKKFDLEVRKFGKGVDDPTVSADAELIKTHPNLSAKEGEENHYSTVNAISTIVTLTKEGDGGRPAYTTNTIELMVKDNITDKNGFEIKFIGVPKKIPKDESDAERAAREQAEDEAKKKDEEDLKENDKIKLIDYTVKPDVELDNYGQVIKTNYTGLLGLERINEISIVCAPDGKEEFSKAIIEHCEKLKDRFAVYQRGIDETLPDKISELRPYQDYKYAAIYAPWLTVLDPLTEKPKHIPPSGFIAGIYARNDTERGVHKAPANEVIRGVMGVPTPIDNEKQATLNPRGVNCIRIFSGRGIVVWGARTNSSNPNWKYINVRRLFIFLSKSIERATQWVVFEPNNEKLWSDVTATITQFLTGVWRTGALMGTTPEEGFFVRCDRSTMTEDDIQNGRLICVIGLATTKPAEFVIFRLTQTKAGATFEEL